LQTEFIQKKSDVWSFGVTLYEIIVRKEPYEGYNLGQVASLVTQGLLTLDIPTNFPVLSQLMKDCLSPDPESRPTFEEIVKILEKSKW